MVLLELLLSIQRLKRPYRRALASGPGTRRPTRPGKSDAETGAAHGRSAPAARLLLASGANLVGISAQGRALDAPQLVEKLEIVVVCEAVD